MADMGFLPEVKRLLDHVRPDRQTLLFSATLDGDVDVLVKRYQHKPVRHELPTTEDRRRTCATCSGRPSATSGSLAAESSSAEWPAIVFCRTKHGADRLAKQLDKTGVAAAAIHGDRSQAQRERALAAFTSGKVQALVATDVAARGIHVDDVACVVHFDPPADEKDYVHRSGRTGGRRRRHRRVARRGAGCVRAPGPRETRRLVPRKPAPPAPAAPPAVPAPPPPTADPPPPAAPGPWPHATGPMAGAGGGAGALGARHFKARRDGVGSETQAKRVYTRLRVIA